MDIAFIGNFKPPYSPENDRKWSLLSLGVNVSTFGEGVEGDV